MRYPDHVIILAGGVGGSFWPLTGDGYPKLFHDVLGIGVTMLQRTFQRFCNMVPVHRIHVITFKSYAGIVASQLPGLPKENIIEEPLSRNTAPCIIYACFRLLKLDPLASVLISPADHEIEDEDEFHTVCDRATDFVSRNDALLTLGMRPTYPNTRYGYIQLNPFPVEANIYPVRQYVEKPYLELAKSFIKSGNFLWNSGMFFWKLKDIVRACERFLPAMFSLFNASLDFIGTRDETGRLEKLYSACPDISIDFGIMEKADNVFIIPAFFNWCDVGTWGNAWAHMEKDTRLNAVSGKNIRVIDSTGCVVHTWSGKVVVIEGLTDYIVADTEDGLLICKRDNEKSVRDFLSETKRIDGN